jgi:hypothetical protein
MTWREEDHPRDEVGRFTFKEQLRQEEIALHKNDNKKAPVYTDAEVNALERQNIDTEDIKTKKKPFIIMQLFGGREHKEFTPRLSKIEQKELMKKLRNLEPIPLKINEKIIYAKYDKYGAKKYLKGDKLSTPKGFNDIKIKMVDTVINSLINATYLYSEVEKHKKNTPVHNNSKIWSYFITHITNNGDTYEVIINVRETINGVYYFYDIQVK